MKTDNLECSIEEFEFMKTQLIKRFPELKDLEWDSPDKMVEQASKLLNAPVKKGIENIKDEYIKKCKKLSLISYIIERPDLYPPEKIEELTGVPIKDLARAHANKIIWLWFVFCFSNIIRHCLFAALILYVFHISTAVIILMLYLIIKVVQGIFAPRTLSCEKALDSIVKRL